MDGFASFASAEAGLVQWLDDEAWTTGDGPRALFYAAVAWLREGEMLLPGVTTLVELVATVRQAAEDRLYDTLATIGDCRAGPLPGGDPGGSAGTAALAAGPVAPRRAQHDRPGHGAGPGPGRRDRRAAHGWGGIASVPTRRVIELARYGLAAKAPKLARHPYPRRIATLLATVRWLEVTATDDALELFDVLMSNELIGRAGKTTDREKLRRHAGHARHAGVLRTAVEVLLEAAEWGGNVSLESVWEAIDNAVGSAGAAAGGRGRGAGVHPAAGRGSGGAVAGCGCRAVRHGPRVREDAVPGDRVRGDRDAPKVLTAMRDLPGLLEAAGPPGEYRRTTWTPGGSAWTWCRAAGGSGWCSPRAAREAPWTAMPTCSACSSFPHPPEHRDIFAVVSDRWSDPRARLLTGSRVGRREGRRAERAATARRPRRAAGRACRRPGRRLAGGSGRHHSTSSVTSSVDADGRLHVGQGQRPGRAGVADWPAPAHRRACCPGWTCPR